MSPCSGHGNCSTGVAGNGQCACSTGWSGSACNQNDACDANRLPLDMGALVSSVSSLQSFYGNGRTSPNLGSFGVVADFETINPATIYSLSFFAFSKAPNAQEVLYRPSTPKSIQVTIYYNNVTTGNKPGNVWFKSSVFWPWYLRMEAGSQLMNQFVKIIATFPSASDLSERILWPGKYWIQIEIEDNPYWNIAVQTSSKINNFEDYFIDRESTLGNSTWANWVPAKDVLAGGAAHAELMYSLEFARCLPVYTHQGIPLPKTVIDKTFVDFFPKEAITGETLTFTFQGYVSYSQKALIKIANPLVGYGCTGQAAGGEPQPLSERQVRFTMGSPGYYSVCIQPEGDIDWEEATSLLHVTDVKTQDPFYGYDTCAAVTSHNTTVCGCMYDQPGARAQDVIAVPMDYPFKYLTTGSVPVLIRQGCCLFNRDQIDTFPWVLPGTVTQVGSIQWQTCSNLP